MSKRALFLFAISIITLQQINAIVEKITYRNWTDCYKIKNDSITIIINASAGGRIMSYERNGINVIYENSSQNGLLLSDYRSQGFDPDGGRFDLGQEQTTAGKHAILFMGHWTGEIIDDYTLKITSPEDTVMGILATRVFKLYPNSSRLNIVQTMKNISLKPTQYFFWGRTLVKLGGKIFMPLNPQSQYPKKWGRYIWGPPDKFECDTTDKGVVISDSIFSLNPATANNYKYGNDSHAAWMAYGYKSLLFIKKNTYFPDKPYGEFFGLTNIFYTNRSSFCEMEPISPVANLNPGEEYSYTEDWYLLNYAAASKPYFDVKSATSFVVQQSKSLETGISIQKSSFKFLQTITLTHSVKGLRLYLSFLSMATFLQKSLTCRVKE
jgi:hypothetical protein